MFDNLFNFPLSFILLILIWFTITGLFFSFQKKNILSNYKQIDSKELKNINGTIILDSGSFQKNRQWRTFDLLINQNSIFLFPKSFFFIPGRTINLFFSNKDKKYTKNSSLLREYKIYENNIEFIDYPNYLIRNRKIHLKNLTPDQISLLENSLQNKSRRMY